MVFAGVLAGLGVADARRVRRADVAAAGVAGQVLRVPRAPGGVVVDGDSDDGAWVSSESASAGAGRTGLFVGLSVDSRGRPATPASEARLLWGDGHLYVLLYAADEDVRSRGDFFRVTFTPLAPRGARTRPFVFDVGPSGPLPPGVHAAREIDGTVDDARDRDEEWLVEMAVPLQPMGLRAARGQAFGFRVRRCDASADETEAECAGWGEEGDEGRVVLE